MITEKDIVENVSFLKRYTCYMLASCVIKNPCDFTVSVLDYFMQMTDKDFAEMAINSIVKNKEKRETGIETVPQRKDTL